jgi:hypothetical protein
VLRCRFSLANIPNGSRLLWVHVASVYVVTVITLVVSRGVSVEITTGVS